MGIYVTNFLHHFRGKIEKYIVRIFDKGSK